MPLTPTPLIPPCPILCCWTAGGLCPVCTGSTADRIEPLLAQWEPDSDAIGDFSWSGGYTAAVTSRARKVLQTSGFECSFGVVELVQPDADTWGKVCVPYPYTGPELSWLMPTECILLDERKTGISGGPCPGCGEPEYPFKREGIVIDRSGWGGRLMFRIRQFGKSDATFVTEQAVERRRNAGLTNLGCHEAGLIM